MTSGKLEIVLRIISTNLIPLVFTFTAVFSDFFSSIFIRNKNVLYEYKKYISYLVVGQSVFIGPIAAMINIFDFLVFEKDLGGRYLIVILSIYILIYSMFFLLYLRMGADGYEKQVLAIKWIYALTPASVMTLSVILQILPILSLI